MYLNLSDTNVYKVIKTKSTTSTNNEEVKSLYLCYWLYEKEKEKEERRKIWTKDSKILFYGLKHFLMLNVSLQIN